MQRKYEQVLRENIDLQNEVKRVNDEYKDMHTGHKRIANDSGKLRL